MGGERIAASEAPVVLPRAQVVWLANVLSKGADD